MRKKPTRFGKYTSGCNGEFVGSTFDFLKHHSETARTSQMREQTEGESWGYDISEDAQAEVGGSGTWVDTSREVLRYGRAPSKSVTDFLTVNNSLLERVMASSTVNTSREVLRYGSAPSKSVTDFLTVNNSLLERVMASLEGGEF